MSVSVLLRLVTEILAQGRVVGRAEIVDTGETLVFKDQAEMVAFLLRSATTGNAGIANHGAPPAVQNGVPPSAAVASAQAESV